MMRRLFFFAFGLLLGSWCAISFASPTAAGSRINLNLTPSAPSGVTLSGAWDAVVPGLEDTGYGGYRPGTAGAGSAEIYRGVATRVDGVPLALEAKRGITARNLAKGALNFAKRGGPAGLIRGALVGAGLSYLDGVWRGLVDDPNAPQTSTTNWTTAQICAWDLSETRVHVYSGGYTIWTLLDPSSGPNIPSGYTNYGNCTNRAYAVVNGSVYFPRVLYKTVSGQYQTPTVQRDYSDQELEDLLTDNLVNGDLTPEQALQELIEQGDVADGDALNGYLEPVQGSGPSSLSGGTSTSVSSSAAGQTTTTTSTGYDIAYGPAGAVGITKNQTTTTTTPDGQTTTTENTERPANGQNNKPADEKPFCELYPDAMACQPLGTPSPVELPTGTINVPGLSYESVTAACPAPYTFTPTAGGSYEISWQPVCDGAEAVRPVVIVIGLLTAGVFVFVGMRRGQS